VQCHRPCGERRGKGHDTGWLVKAEDFFPNRKGVLLLTNNHVVSQMPNPRAIFPWDSQVNFQALGTVFQVEDEVVWSSPYMELDATLLALKGEPQAKPLELSTRAMQMVQPPPRMYIIGHPRGRDLELSLQDNHLEAQHGENYRGDRKCHSNSELPAPQRNVQQGVRRATRLDH
jgi:Trypsin-like peptidase domain